MNTTEKTEENIIAKDVFRLLGALIALAFGALFFLLKLLGNSNNADESEDPLGEQYYREYSDLTSSSPEARLNPLNVHNDYD